jgi:prevent-host-death family protein
MMGCMKSISALDVRARFGQVLDEAAAGERFIVERAGQPVAAIVPLSDLDAMDPVQVRARRLAAVEELTRYGRRHRERLGHTDAAAAVRWDRDHGHRP